jgi:hypothetical protein
MKAKKAKGFIGTLEIWIFIGLWAAKVFSGTLGYFLVHLMCL